MEIKQNSGKKNVFDITGVENEIREVVNYVDRLNTAGFDKNILIDIKTQLIGMKVANIVDSKGLEVPDAVMSSPIIRVLASEMKNIDDTLENDIYVTYTRTKISDDNELKAFSVI